MRGYNLTPFLRPAFGFERYVPAPRRGAPNPAADAGYPSYNFAKLAEDSYSLALVVPGFADEELDVTVDDGVLVVTGKHVANDDDGVTYLRRGFAPRDFERRFTLAEDIEVTEAKLENGVLHVALKHHVPEHRKPRRIEIGAGENRQAA